MYFFFLTFSKRKFLIISKLAWLFNFDLNIIFYIKTRHQRMLYPTIQGQIFNSHYINLCVFQIRKQTPHLSFGCSLLEHEKYWKETHIKINDSSKWHIIVAFARSLLWCLIPLYYFCVSKNFPLSWLKYKKYFTLIVILPSSSVS